MVIDQGDGRPTAAAARLGRIAKTSPAVVFSLLQQLEALGLNVPTVLQQLGSVGGEPPPPADAAARRRADSDAIAVRPAEIDVRA